MAAPAFRPPPDFEPAPSAVDGITVYRPKDPALAGPATFKCPSCAATTGFAPDAGALVCGFCGWKEPIDTARARDVAHDFTVEALRLAAHGWGVARRTLRCPDCGTERAVEAAAISTLCPFCAGTHVEVSARDDGAALRPSHVLPFEVRSEALAGPVKAWLGQGWFHPSRLADLARVDRFVGVYVPYWVFEAAVEADYECEVGYTHTRTVPDGRGGSRTETYTVWTWTRGHVSRRFDHVRIPGTTRLSKVLLGRVDDAFDLGRLEPFDARFLAGFEAQGYDVALPDAWERGKGEIRDGARRACESDAGGDKIRNLSVAASLSEEAWRYALLPIWVTAYRFDGRTWQVMVNGATGAVHGQKPVVWSRVWVAIAALIAPGVCGGVVGIPLALVGVGVPIVIVSLGLLIAGLVGSGVLYGHLRQSEIA